MAISKKPEDSPEVQGEGKTDKFCKCGSPWCEAQIRLGRKDLRDVRVYSGLLFAHTTDDHVEKEVGTYE